MGMRPPRDAMESILSVPYGAGHEEGTQEMALTRIHFCKWPVLPQPNLFSKGL